MNTLFPADERQGWIVMLLAMLLPVAAILFYPTYFQPDDMQDFIRWGKSWETNWRSIYLDCTLCAYPFLGTFFSGGVISFLDFEKVRHVVRAFHGYLALIDALNVLIMYFILRKIEVKNSAFWAGVIGLLPSSWVGTSYWGQIDGLGQCLILMIFLNTIVFNKSVDLSTAKYRLYLIFSGLLLSCLLLTKQLVLFSLISLGGMILANVILRSRGGIDSLFSLVILAFSFFLPIFIIDTVVQIPPPYSSHLFYVFEIGSRIADVVSSYGFNIWILFYPDTLVSSHIPLLDSSIEISPFTLGLSAFLTINLIMFISMFRYFVQKYKSKERFFQKSDILLWLFHLSFVNLSFNIFLTGTHERYLYHFYPFILMAFLGASVVRRHYMIYVLLFGAFFYGAFLYGYLSNLNSLFQRLPFYAMAIFHGLLLLYLVITIKKNFLPRNDFGGSTPRI